MLMRELSESPADVMENLSFGLSVDHVLAVTVSGLLGAVWKYVGPQYVFLLGAAVCTVHLGVALWLKRQRRAAAFVLFSYGSGISLMSKSVLSSTDVRESP